MINIQKLNPKKILIINTFGIGDVLFTTPFISNLKTNLPGVEIGYVGNRRTEPTLLDNPEVDKVFVYERDEFMAVYNQSKLKFLKKIKGFLKLIKNENYDIVFDFSLNTTASFYMLLIGIKYRLGFNYRNRGHFLTHKIPFLGFEKKHVVEFYLDLLEEIGLSVHTRELVMHIDAKDQKWAEDFLAENGLTDKQTLVGVLPGGGASWGKDAYYRRWSQENYAKLVDKMVEKFGVNIILMGDKSEKELCSEVLERSHSRVVSAFGQTNIGQFAALMSKCRLVVLNDGGPVHVAVATKTKSVAIFGPVDEHVYGPFGSPQRHFIARKDIACSPCYKRFRMVDCDHVSCLNTLTVEDVFKKVEEALK